MNFFEITLKRKIALGYTLLLIVLLSITLTISYNMVGYQSLSDIKENLILKEKLVLNALSEREHSSSEHSEERSSKRESPRSESDKSESSERTKLRSPVQSVVKSIINDDLAVHYSNGDLHYTNSEIGSKIKYSEIKQIKSGQFVVINADNKELYFIVIKIGKDYVCIGKDLTKLNQLQKRLLNIFIISSLIGVLLSILFGSLLTQHTMNIIKRISETAGSISSANLDKRIDLPKGDDEIVQLIRTLNGMIDRLEKAFAQSKQFTQDAAHEIRTPLTILRGELDEVLSGDSLDSKVTARLESMLDEVHYLSSISERLLLINTLDNRTVRYDFKQIDLTELMDDIYQDATIISGEKKIDISIESQSGLMLNCNKELITRLLWNLIDNAIKYNKESGSIVLRTKSDSNNIIIQIEDNGIGIAESEIPKIFDRFYRVDKAHSRKINGSGLGLSICKWIVQLHEGSIDVESKDGSTFTITLPQ